LAEDPDDPEEAEDPCPPSPFPTQIHTTPAFRSSTPLLGGERDRAAKYLSA